MEQPNYPVYKFTVEITGDVATSEGALPIWDDCRKLVGSFTVLSGDIIIGFLGGQEHPLAIEISIGQPIWIRPRQGVDGLIYDAIISAQEEGLGWYEIYSQQEEAP